MASLVGFFLLPHQQLKYRLIIARLKIKAMEKTIRYCVSHGINKNLNFLLHHLERYCIEFEVIYALLGDTKSL
ncbi:hypothetical protein [Photobacterium iliopiscarium]|jgi:hypothetical protein|uniref:Uncharacterized protein n=1 Tax=Photobacterium iliopiscarium TaxID=56192 RepID=A0ABX5GY63_9GAMM|nr:hypothetical protein [Photobacterium iliopiscarium]KJG13472.1 hypothetical protein UB38_09460 [Photobacterium iliopiscarium]PST96384.1 hypothetical protein C9I87_05145 [Photobacterium iliopiscarium]PSU00088.1 hypothetical protein C9I85_09160 [Photobacterium iliopiscarium]PSV85290.1 hypothetical protein C9J51_03195 [Photobacterium iliopiscarium]PSW99771.1 hypothetical protein C9J52_00795 [Photobacterium iliopiscarium]